MEEMTLNREDLIEEVMSAINEPDASPIRQAELLATDSKYYDVIAYRLL